MKFTVRVHNKFLSEAVQGLAGELGYKWKGIDLPTPAVAPVILFDTESKEIEFKDFVCDPSMLDAKTDWDKIADAMKPKEPRVIWVNEKRINTNMDMYLCERCFTLDNNEAGETNRKIKFIEVLS